MCGWSHPAGTGQICVSTAQWMTCCMLTTPSLLFMQEHRQQWTCWIRCLSSHSLPGDETTYALDTYPEHSLDNYNISINFPTHFWLIFDYLDILWFILTSWCTNDITCWLHSHCDLLPITSQHASPLFHPSYLWPIIPLEIEVFLLISHGHRPIIVMTKVMIIT